MKLVNYLGQLRVYSLLDLMLMLVVAGASPVTLRFWGAVFLWVGFLAYLESKHHDKGREPVPTESAWLLLLAGLVWWREDVTGLLFVICAICYTRKKRKPWGLLSPFLRAAQSFVLVGAFTGFGYGFPWIAAAATGIRNVLGDLRDATEDEEEGIVTWPTVLRCKSHPFAHLWGVFGTTVLWWWHARELPGCIFPTLLAVELVTYWLTPRPSNKNAAVWLQNKILKHFLRWGGR